MTYTDLPQYWKDRLKRDFGTNLCCSDFVGENVFLQFEDGSSAAFRYAFVIPGDNSFHNHALVVTENCGYHTIGYPTCRVTGSVKTRRDLYGKW